MILSSISNILIRATSVGILLFVNIQLARSLGPEGFGLFSFHLAWIQLVAIVVQFGLPTALTRTVTLAMNNGEGEKVQNQVITSLTLILLIWTTISTIFAIIWLLITTPRGGLSIAVPSILMALIISIGPVIAAVHRSLGYIVTSQIPEQIARPGLFSIFLGSTLLIQDTLTPVNAMWIQLVTAGAVVITSIIFLWQCMPKCTKIGPIRPLLLAKDTIPFLLLTVVQGFSTYITIIALGYILTEDQIGQFRVANQISEALNIILLGISVVIAPKITISHAQQNWGDLRYTLIHAHRAGIALLIVPVIMLTVWGAPILGIVFGQAYTPAYDAMQILLIGKLIYCLFGFSGLVLAVTGEASKATLATTFSTLFMMLLLYPLVAYFGITGAALAHAIGGILNAVFCAMLIPKKYKSMSAISSPKCR